VGRTAARALRPRRFDQLAGAAKWAVAEHGAGGVAFADAAELLARVEGVEARSVQGRDPPAAEGGPVLPGQRVRELIAPLGFAGGKTVVDDYLREVRPLFRAPRTFQRTVYRPGEICQFDLWEPRAL